MAGCCLILEAKAVIFRHVHGIDRVCGAARGTCAALAAVVVGARIGAGVGIHGQVCDQRGIASRDTLFGDQALGQAEGAETADIACVAFRPAAAVISLGRGAETLDRVTLVDTEKARIRRGDHGFESAERERIPQRGKHRVLEELPVMARVPPEVCCLGRALLSVCKSGAKTLESHSSIGTHPRCIALYG